MEENEALLKAFVEESREHLVTIEADLLLIEENGGNIDEDLVNKVFRAAHSIKGSSGFFGFQKIKELAHRAETVLDMLRSRKMHPNAEVTNILLAAFDRLREMINNTETSEQAGIADLVDGLADLASSHAKAGSAASEKANGKQATRADHGHDALPQATLDTARRKGQFIYRIDCNLVGDVDGKGKDLAAFFAGVAATGDILVSKVDAADIGTLDDFLGNRLPLELVVATVLDPDIIPGLFDTIEPDRIQLVFDPRAVPKAAPIPAVETPPVVPPPPKPGPVAAKEKPAPNRTPPPPARNAEKAAPAAGSEETLRVDVRLLENLMNLAGELVLSRNQVRVAVAQGNAPMLASAEQRINQVTSELQDVIMQTRLQPINNVFAKFPRLVRDLSRSLGKEIRLDILGKEVALDKTLIEGLSDPLTHMVRNAVDHGIETTEDRVTAGKGPEGTVRIESRYEAGQVVVEVSDDGKGLDPVRLAEAALNKGLISPEKLLGMSDRDKQALIFLPGLSTAKQVSDVSGRGVGMDVVKTNLDRLGGQVEIISQVGKGSTFRIKLPLTLAIIPSLIISVEEERFAIPQTNIVELLRLRPEEIKDRIEVVGNRSVLLLRDSVLPLARFADLLTTVPTYVDPVTGRREVDRRVQVADRRSPRHPLSGPPAVSAGDAPGAAGAASKAAPAYSRRSGDRRAAATSAMEIAVVTTGAMTYGLVVGAFHETEEVVVKPLGRRLKHLREYSGATILGDGAVALILDISGLAAKSGLAPVTESARAKALAAEAEAHRLQDIHSLLLFHNGPDEPCAIPLDLVQRIERIRPEQVERPGNRRSMQYRGRALPLVTLSDAAAVGEPDSGGELVVVVTSANGHEVGLLGAMPVDVVETKAAIDQVTHRQKGIAGSTILHDRTTLIADLHELVDAVYPEWGAARNENRATAAGAGTAVTVLLAEDSDFFRTQVKKYLEEDGFKVLAAPDGEAAWELLLKHVTEVSVVVTDIEMPRLTGLGLAGRIRADARTSALPIIAVTSLAGEEDYARGKAAGITEYQTKLDRDQLLASVHNHAGEKGNVHVV